MLALGVILLGLSSLVFLLALVAGVDDPAALVIGGVSIPLNVTGLFLLGAATVLVFIAGLELFRSGTKKGLQHRRDRKKVEKLEKKLAQREADSEDASEDTDSAASSPERTDTPAAAGAGAATASSSHAGPASAADSTAPKVTGSDSRSSPRTTSSDADPGSDSAGWKFWKS